MSSQINQSSKMATKTIAIKSLEDVLQQNKVEQELPSKEDEQIILQQRIQQAKEELRQLEKEKNELLENTVMQIQQEKDHWNKERASLVQQAKEEGYQEGFSLGETESKQQYQSLIEQANQIVHTAKQDYYATVEANEETIIDLAIHTAKKIIQTELKQNPKSYVEIVKAAIKDLKKQDEVQIFVHPCQYENLLQHKEELKQQLPPHTMLEVYISEQAKENSCIIEFPTGKLDVGIDTQLQEIHTVLREIALELQQ